MIRQAAAGVAADAADGMRLIGRILRVCIGELGELVHDTSRWRQCLMAALVVPLAITFALMLGLDSVWWAGISAFVTVLATGSASLKRGLVRIGATTAGVVVAFIGARWLPYNPMALTLFLALTAFLGSVGMVVSANGMAWLLATVTANMVLLSGLADPLVVPTVAFNRWGEVIVGVTASALVTNLVAPGRAPDRPAVAARGWRHLLDDDWPVALQGLRAALAVVILLFVWIQLELPELDQMAITVAVVMAAPGAGVDGRHAVAERALHRFLGCLIGGMAALGCLALSIDAFVPWLLIIAVAMWICMHLQTSRHGVGYLGTQAAVVFIVTLAQGAGPPSSLLPGIDRFVGITGGLLVLMVVSVALWPHVDERHGHA
ncbi:MAG TPA: FUSC family protein [Reyranella sp.]|jgi:uncharacterized membrane protein YccC